MARRVIGWMNATFGAEVHVSLNGDEEIFVLLLLSVACTWYGILTRDQAEGK